MLLHVKDWNVDEVVLLKNVPLIVKAMAAVTTVWVKIALKVV